MQLKRHVTAMNCSVLHKERLILKSCGMHLCGGSHTAIPDSFCTAVGRQSEVDDYAGWATGSVRSGTRPDGEWLHSRLSKQIRSTAGYCDRLTHPNHTRTMQPTCQRYNSS